MTKLKMALASFVLVAFASFAIGQGAGFFPNWPLVGGSSYCAVLTNNSCTQTIPAGPTIVTGSETIPANTSLTDRSPANVLVSMASLNALPVTYVNYTGGTTGTSAAILSGSNISGGAYFISGGTITLANVSLPLSPIDGQQFLIGSNVTLTALKVSVTPTSTATISNNPTALTISTTGTYGYAFRYRSTNTTWYRIR